MLDMIGNWLNKQVRASHTAEYHDFVSFVVYPKLLKKDVYKK